MAPLVPRDGSSSNGLTPTAIAGFAFVGAVVFATIIWLAVRFYRKRSKGNRENGLGAAFLNVRGIVKEGEFDEKETEPLPGDIQALQGPLFSRVQNAGVVMPKRVLTRPNATKEEIVKYHAEAGNLPRPFTPFSFALAAGGKGVPHPSLSGDNSSRFSTSSFGTAHRDSFLSVGSSSHRLSTVSTISSLGQSGKRKVRQLFEPVLPDELVLSVGERLTVMQSFDDGWCIVGRPSLMKGSDVELGAVPAWCFIKPVKGLRAERPMRIASLGVTVQLDQPNCKSREAVMSWSNF